jgi:undecaprenyl-diphosphatase
MNQYFFNLIFSLHGRHFLIDDLAIFFAKYLPYLLVLGFFVLIFRQAGWRSRLFLFIEGALATILSRGLLTEIIRFFYHHPRPFEVSNFMPLITQTEIGNSFPSGHATFYFALAIVVFLWNRRWGMWYFILTIVMGFARIFVGAHWPLDVLGGAIIGILSGLLIHLLLSPQFKSLSQKPITEEAYSAT